MSVTFTLSDKKSILTSDYFPPIEINVDEVWCLGLIGLYTWNSIPNIEEGLNNAFFYDKEKLISIPTGSYELTDIEEYLRDHLYVNSNEIRKESKDDANEKILSLKANNNTLQCELKCMYDIDFRSPQSIGSLLGFTPKLLEANRVHISELPVSIIKITNIRVECNITSSAYHNSNLSHTLFEFSPNVPPGYKLDVEPHNVIYLPVNTQTISNITLRIVDQEGRLVNFQGENIVIRLELKKWA